MSTVLRRIWLATVLLAAVHLTSAQQSEVVTITEPRIYKLEELFKDADVVALVRIVSGDVENYNIAVYKGEVIRSFKGVPQTGTLYFGPYAGKELGSEYVLFLHTAPGPISPKTTPKASYGTIRYSEIFDEGYSAMKSSYECVFDDKDTFQACDDSVRVCTDYIKLPKSTRTFPPVNENTPFGCRWTRKKALIALLEVFASAKK